MKWRVHFTKHRRGCPYGIDDERLQQLVRDTPPQTTCQVADLFGVSQSTLVEHVREFGFASKLSEGIPHQLRKKQCQGHADTADSLQSFRRTKIELNLAVIGDAKCVLYADVQGKG